MKFVSVLSLVCEDMEIQRNFCVGCQIPGNSTVSLTSAIWNCILMNLELLHFQELMFCFVGVCFLFTHSYFMRRLSSDSLSVNKIVLQRRYFCPYFKLSMRSLSRQESGQPLGIYSRADMRCYNT